MVFHRRLVGREFHRLESFGIVRCATQRLPSAVRQAMSTTIKAWAGPVICTFRRRYWLHQLHRVHALHDTACRSDRETLCPLWRAPARLIMSVIETVHQMYRARASRTQANAEPAGILAKPLAMKAAASSWRTPMN